MLPKLPESHYTPCKAGTQPHLVPWWVKIIDILHKSKAAFSLPLALSVAKTGGKTRSANLRAFSSARCFWKERAQSFKQPDFMKWHLDYDMTLQIWHDCANCEKICYFDQSGIKEIKRHCGSTCITEWLIVMTFWLLPLLSAQHGSHRTVLTHPHP